MAGPPMITPRYGHGLAVVDGQLWVIGGKGVDGGYGPDGRWRGVTLPCEYLDAAANAWIVGPNILAPSLGATCCVMK